MSTLRSLSCVALIGSILLPLGWVEDSAKTQYYKAYYLECEKGDFAAAAELYAEVAASGDTKLAERAGERLASCREEIACSDFAHIMPPNPWAYVEVNRPGGQLKRLLSQLGLMRGTGVSLGDASRRLEISPELIDGLLGVRGAALAITNVNMNTQLPSGILALHPGDLDVIRGLIETALPAGAEPKTAIQGYPTWRVEDQVYVTLTHKLVLISDSKREIKKAVARLSGEDEASLADNAMLAETLEGRDDSLLYFCVNAKAIMPMVNMGLGMAAAQNPEVALAQQFLDLNSLRSLSGRMGVCDEGLLLDLELRLDEDHQNVAYNLIRSPVLDPSILKGVPEGAAFFGAFSLNESHPYQSSEPDVVMAADIGREVFGNIVGAAVFGMPPAEGQAAGGPPIPDVGLVLTVNDPAKSTALWTLLLGVGSVASGASPKPGAEVEVSGGLAARSFEFPEGITAWFVNDGRDIIVTTSRAALESTLAGRRSGRSVLDDEVFAPNAACLSGDTTDALFAHPGRCAAMAAPFMSSRDRAEMEPYLDLLSETVVSVAVNHSASRLNLSTMVTGLPKLDGLVAELLENGPDAFAANFGGHAPMIRTASAVEQPQWEEPSPAKASAQKGVETLEKKFWKLAGTPGSDAEAHKMGERLLAMSWNDAARLNTTAWVLLTEEPYAGSYTDLAWRMSDRSNQMTDFFNWIYVDTLAHAQAQRGKLDEAIELQRKAVNLAAGDDRQREAEAALERFLEARESQPAAGTAGSPATSYR